MRETTAPQAEPEALIQGNSEQQLVLNTTSFRHGQGQSKRLLGAGLSGSGRMEATSPDLTSQIWVSAKENSPTSGLKSSPDWTH